MEKDNIYQAYSMELVKNVPEDQFKYLIKLFMNKASVNMGCDFNDKSLNGSIEIVSHYFSYIPIHYVASAFIRGSLGDYGAGRLVPRTVKAWHNEMSQEYNRDQAAKLQKDKLNDVSIAMDLHKSPVGTAIMKKIDWYRKGSLDMRDWDKVPLKDLADKIKQGIYVTPEMFGIKSKV